MGAGGASGVSTERKRNSRDHLVMSDGDDHQRLLQILEAHGQQFLNSFENPQKPSSSRRKLDSSSVSSGEDEEWHGFGTVDIGSGDSEDEDSVDSFHGSMEFNMPDLTSAYGRRV